MGCPEADAREDVEVGSAEREHLGLVGGTALGRTRAAHPNKQLPIVRVCCKRGRATANQVHPVAWFGFKVGRRRWREAPSSGIHVGAHRTR
jgi:hypothetical protein